ncbi:MAG TPA: RHS repeat-associated core domain-containing protein [Candidatus Angelobacter sp.]|nr:RHS repeat-associated core domain-containing protein [Candidatus Angelobacter sp.]
MKLHAGTKISFSIGLLVLLIATAGAGEAQSFLTGQSERNASAPEPVELGYVESANGALHLEIPLGKFPQRGSDDLLNYRLIYDSSIWTVSPGGVWQATSNPLIGAGWRQTPPFAPAPVQATITNQPPPPANPCDTTYSDFNWTDPAGVTHFFAIKTIQLFNPSSNCATDTPTGDAFATDSSGYHLYITNYINSKLYAPDGTLVSAAPNQQINGNTVMSVDTNGNYLSFFLHVLPSDGPSMIYDTAGHSFPQTSPTGYLNPVMPTSQGSSTFTITYATINVKTAFGQQHVTECTNNCTIQVIQSIGLPDGTSYSFQYDCDSTAGSVCGSAPGRAAYYGVMTGMTLPSGGQITYGYIVFADSYSNKSLWLNSRTAAGGTWAYTPQVISTCAPQTVGCQQKVTATKPNGDRTEYLFTLNNGLWPTQTQHFDGATGNLLSTESATWDFSHTCPLTNCFGASFVLKTMDAITLPMPNGTSVTKQTQYFYDSPQTANITAIKEWGYAGAGGFGVFPDKARYITYLNTGTNNINRPTSVTLCNNVGSDSDCNGVGSKVSQTKTTYDNYGTSSCRSGTSGLIAVTGAANHDDSNFGTGNTARGNPTSIQKWVSGTTFLTTQYFYDTTGQVIQQTDPAGNAMCLDYTDNFFTDDGNNPPKAFTSAQPTNTYLTTITLPVTGTEKRGYYFGSGNRALATDQNGATIYSHYLDPLDRPTGKVFPITWSLTTYTGATQIDNYTGVADTTASASCTGCRHTQTLVDNMGRRNLQTIVNKPGGAANVATTYDLNGRVQSLSHAYVNQTDPTHVFEQTTYDGLDRALATTHPDGQSTSTAFGSLVAPAGLSTQQSSTSTYGVGYPMLMTDEAGKQKQEWIDGLGRIIEVDEPGGEDPSSAGTASGSVIGSEESFQTLVSPATSGSGSVQISGGVQWKTVSNASTGGTTSIAIGGGEQQFPVGIIAGSGTVAISGHEQVLPAVAATGSVTINGTLQSKQVLTQAATHATATIAISGQEVNGDVGTITLNAGSASVTISYGYLMTARTAASNLASNLNSSQVTAVASSLGDDFHWQIKLTAIQAGTGGNSIGFSVSQMSYYGYAPPYGVSPASGNLGGAIDNQYVTVYDSGTCTVTINNHGDSKSWSGSGTTAAGIASGLATSIGGDGSAFVNASASSNVVSFTAKSQGAATNYGLSSSCSYDSSNFAGASFTTTNSSSNLTGGRDPIYDSGTFTATVNGHATTPATSWGQVSTPASIAADLAAKVNADAGAAVTAVSSATNGGYRIQSSGGSAGYKYYADFGPSQSGVAYTVQVSVRNNGTTFAQVNSNFNFVNIAPGTTQNVVLNFAGNGTSDVQLLFYVVSSNVSDPMDITVWNPYVAKVSDGVNLLSSAQTSFAGGWNPGPGATVNATADARVPQVTRIQTSGGSTAYKYYADFGQSQSGLLYTLQVTVKNNGTAIAQVSSNLNSVNIAPGSTQNVVLNFLGNGASNVQFLFDTVTNVSDSLDLTVWNPYLAKASDGINLVSPAQLNFAGWTLGPGATVTVTSNPQVVLVDFIAKIKGSISNYNFSIGSSFDSAHFGSSSFSNTNSGTALTGGWPNPSAVDSGTMTVTINGHNYPVNWGQSDTPGSIATNLVSAISADANVSPTLSGTTVYLNPKQPGTAYSFATGVTYDSADFMHSSFASANAISDWGTMAITVNGHSDSVPWAGLSNPSTIAAALAGKIDGDAAAVVTSTATAGIDGVVANTKGANTNYALASSTTFDSANFATASFSTCNTNPTSTGSCTSSNSVMALAGGADAVYNTTYDSGTVTATVNGFQVTVPYQQGSTANSLAAAMASGFNSPSSPVTASASGPSITLTAAAGTNLAITTSASTSQAGAFGDPSFSLTLSQNVLNGGSAPGGSLSTPLVTSYTYDAADRLTQVIQGAQTRTYVYDGLGRVISETTPEAGTVTNSYTVSGGGLCSGDPDDACSTTDARGVVTSYSYDALSRLAGIRYTIPSGSGVSAMPNNVCTPTGSQTQANVCIYHDQGGAQAFALGRRTQIVDPSGSETFTYNVQGQVTQIKKVIGANTYTTGYQYNVAGDLTKITYPSGRVVQQSYDAIGQLCEIAPSTTGCGTAASPYSTAYSYDAAGSLTGFNYGNGVAASFSFSADRSQLSALSYKKSTQTLFSLNYLYKNDSTNCPTGTNGNNGQIQCIQDNVDSGRTTSYGYDALSRLTGAVTHGSASYPQWGLRWDYDRYGNRTAQSVTAGSAPAAQVSFDSATNRPNGYIYDAAGNLIVEPLSPPNDYTYDGDNQMTAFSGGGGSGTYTYDAHGLRVQKAIQGGTTTVSVSSMGKVIAEYDNGALPASPSREYVYDDSGSNTRLLSTITGTTAVYHHADHLSGRLITDGTAGSSTLGQVTGQEGHFPYGEAWYQNGTTTKWIFTSYGRDNETGLDYAIARFYNSRIGVFCSVDPQEGNPYDPQSWNRYAYVENDPIDLVDPNGQSFLSILLDLFTLGFSSFFGGSDFLTTTNGSIGDQAALVDAASLALESALVAKQAQTKPKPKPQPKHIRCVTIPGHNPIREGESQELRDEWKKHPDKHLGAISQQPPGDNSVAVNPKQFGMTKSRMARLRKQGKGITGTLTDANGNSTSISVDDTIASKDYPGNVKKQINNANKQGRTIIEEEGQDYGGFPHDKSATLDGWMVHCPPGMKEEPPAPAPKN